jgi:hypothetical protein
MPDLFLIESIKSASPSFVHLPFWRRVSMLLRQTRASLSSSRRVEVEVILKVVCPGTRAIVASSQ